MYLQFYLYYELFNLSSDDSRKNSSYYKNWKNSKKTFLLNFKVLPRFFLLLFSCFCFLIICIGYIYLYIYISISIFISIYLSIYLSNLLHNHLECIITETLNPKIEHIQTKYLNT